MTSSTEPSEPVASTASVEAAVDDVPAAAAADAKPVNGADDEPTNTTAEPEAESTSSKRKRSTKKVVENTESISNARPRRTLTKRE